MALKKEVKKLEQIYGGYLSPIFVEGLLNISKEARVRARYNLDDLVSLDSTSSSIAVCVEAESFWSLLAQECKEWLNENSSG